MPTRETGRRPRVARRDSAARRRARRGALLEPLRKQQAAVDGDEPLLAEGVVPDDGAASHDADVQLDAVAVPVLLEPRRPSSDTRRVDLPDPRPARRRLRVAWPRAARRRPRAATGSRRTRRSTGTGASRGPADGSITSTTSAVRQRACSAVTRALTHVARTSAAYEHRPAVGGVRHRVAAVREALDREFEPLFRHRVGRSRPSGDACTADCDRMPGCADSASRCGFRRSCRLPIETV